MKISVTLEDLIKRGHLQAPTRIFGSHSGKNIVGRVLRDGSIQIGRDRFASPSVAAGVAITKATGRLTPGRRYFSINGWFFWFVGSTSDRGPVLLDDLRKNFEMES